jgi:hypothetical protein
MAEETKKGPAEQESVSSPPPPTEAVITVPDDYITDGSIGDELIAIERGAEVYRRLKIIAIKMTKPTDWVVMGSAPYLLDRGAEVVAAPFGVDIEPGIKLRKEQRTDSRGVYDLWIAEGSAYSRRLGRRVTDIGTCSERDKFFAFNGKELKEVDEIDQANIMKKAVTNLHTRLITKVVGLRGMTLDDLKEAGVELGNLPKVQFAERGKAAPLSDEAMSKVKAVWTLCLELAENDEANARTLLKTASGFQGKDPQGNAVFRSVSDIKEFKSEKWVDSTFWKLRKMYRDRYGSGPVPNEGLFKRPEAAGNGGPR